MTQATNYTKEVYHPNITTLYGTRNWLSNRIKFSVAQQVGKQYVAPVELSPEQGVTYLAANAGRSALNGAIPLSTQDAILQPSQVIVQREVDYEALMRTQGKKAAFIAMFDATARSVTNAAVERFELSMLYGQNTNGIGVVASVGSPSSSGNVGSTLAVTLTDATWSGGLWGGKENALVDVWQTGGTTRRTTALNIGVKSVNLSTKTVTLVVLNTTDSGYASIAATDIFAFGQAGATLGANEMTGLLSIASNTTASYAGISAATYGLWAGNTFTAWGAPSIGKILNAASTLVERGLKEDVYFLVSPKHFARLNGDQTALRMYDSSYSSSTAKNGFQEVAYAAAEGVNVIVKTHPCMMDGFGLFVTLSKCLRVGSTELRFMDMGVNGSIFLQTPGFNTLEVRGYLGQAVLNLAPCQSGLVSGITYP